MDLARSTMDAVSMDGPSPEAADGMDPLAGESVGRVLVRLRDLYG